MALEFHLSDLDNGIMLRCEGRIVCGTDTRELEERVGRLVRSVRSVVLELSGVTFIDSGGLGLLVRLSAVARAAGGDLKLAAPSPQLVRLLEITCLTKVFRLFKSPEEALAASPARGQAAAQGTKRVLCVDPSCDVLAFVRTVLQGEGYTILTTDNVSDARILLRASPPDLVLLGPNLDPVRATATLRAQSPQLRVVPLDAEFHHIEAAAATEVLLGQVRNAAA